MSDAIHITYTDLPEMLSVPPELQHHTVEVIFAPVARPYESGSPTNGDSLSLIMEELSKYGGQESAFEDPVQWQRETRKEKPIEGRTAE